MNNNKTGPPLDTSGGAQMPSAEGITLGMGSQMNDAAGPVAENAITIAGSIVRQYFLQQSTMFQTDNSCATIDDVCALPTEHVSIARDAAMMPCASNEPNAAGDDLEPIAGAESEPSRGDNTVVKPVEGSYMVSIRDLQETTSGGLVASACNGLNACTMGVGEPQACALDISTDCLTVAGMRPVTRVLRGNIWKSLWRRLTCRPLFIRWFKLSFLYRWAEHLRDQHLYSSAPLTLFYDSAASKAYLEHRWRLRGKLRWLLFCMQFRRLSWWAKMLILPHVLELFLRCFKWFSKWWQYPGRYSSRATNTPVLVWSREVIRCILWYYAICLVYFFLRICEPQFAGFIIPIHHGCLGNIFAGPWSTLVWILLYGLLYLINTPAYPALGDIPSRCARLALQPYLWASSIHPHPDIDAVCIASVAWSPESLTNGCLSTLHRAVALIMTGLSWFIGHLEAAISSPSFLLAYQLLPLLWFLLLHCRIMPSWDPSTMFLSVEQTAGDGSPDMSEDLLSLHVSKLCESIVNASDCDGADVECRRRAHLRPRQRIYHDLKLQASMDAASCLSIVGDSGVPDLAQCAEIELLSIFDGTLVGDQRRCGWRISNTVPTGRCDGSGEAESIDDGYSCIPKMKNEQVVQEGSINQPVEWTTQYSLSEINKLCKLRFADAITCAPRLVGKADALEREAHDALQHTDTNSPKLRNVLTAMLGEARLIDCLSIKILETADAHESHHERRSVIDQINPLGGRMDFLIRRLEVALQASLRSTLEQETLVDVSNAGDRVEARAASVEVSEQEAMLMAIPERAAASAAVLNQAAASVAVSKQATALSLIHI